MLFLTSLRATLPVFFCLFVFALHVVEDTSGLLLNAASFRRDDAERVSEDSPLEPVLEEEEGENVWRFPVVSSYTIGEMICHNYTLSGHSQIQPLAPIPLIPQGGPSSTESTPYNSNNRIGSKGSSDRSQQMTDAKTESGRPYFSFERLLAPTNCMRAMGETESQSQILDHVLPGIRKKVRTFCFNILFKKKKSTLRLSKNINPFAHLSSAERVQIGEMADLFSGVSETLAFLYNTYVRKPQLAAQAAQVHQIAVADKQQQNLRVLDQARTFFLEATQHGRNHGIERKKWAEGVSEIQWWELWAQFRAGILAIRDGKNFDTLQREEKRRSTNRLPTTSDDSFDYPLFVSEDLLSPRISESNDDSASSGYLDSHLSSSVWREFDDLDEHSPLEAWPARAGEKIEMQNLLSIPTEANTLSRAEEYFRNLLEHRGLSSYVNTGLEGPRILTAKKWSHTKNVLFEILALSDEMEVWGPSVKSMTEDYATPVDGPGIAVPVAGGDSEDSRGSSVVVAGTPLSLEEKICVPAAFLSSGTVRAERSILGPSNPATLQNPQPIVVYASSTTGSSNQGDATAAPKEEPAVISYFQGEDPRIALSERALTAELQRMSIGHFQIIVARRAVKLELGLWTPFPSEPEN